MIETTFSLKLTTIFNIYKHILYEISQRKFKAKINR